MPFGFQAQVGHVAQDALAQRDVGQVGNVALQRVLGIRAAIDVVEQERRQPALRCGTTRGPRTPGFVVIEGAQRGVHELEVGMRGGARAFGVAGQHRVHHLAVLVGQWREGPRRGVELLAALRDIGLQQFEQPAHHLQQHQVVRRLGDGQVEGRVGLRFAGGIVFAVRIHHGLERLRDAGAVLVSGAQRGVPGGGAFQYGASGSSSACRARAAGSAT
ncbi:hypothetical protein G6F65_017705 [Rhizopus arrhizus]|nr:hypothetical protein G6F65_017705 [Rhizopus arrhizus]